MPNHKFSLSFVTACLLAFLVVFPAVVFGQTKPDQKPEQKPDPSDAQDVIKFETSLVQTDVMVFDKKGRFVEGLKPDQFQLKINNNPREISFFEAIKSGSASSQPEEPNAAAAGPKSVNTLKADAQRRAIIFFVDDLHLAPDSLSRTRRALLDFIDHRVHENDLVAITSPSGQVGFLQQFTANKDALRSAVDRLNYRNAGRVDLDRPPMSQY